MDHQHVIQHRSTAASHSLPRSRSSGRAGRKAGGGGGPGPGQSHAMTKRGGRRGGRRSDEGPQQVPQGRPQHDAPAWSLPAANSMVPANPHLGRIDGLGRCVRHPTIELCKRDGEGMPWRVLLQDCPLCSLDDSLGGRGGGDRPPGGMCGPDADSQTAGTRNTGATQTTAEESSVRSWTVSDASENDVGAAPPDADAQSLLNGGAGPWGGRQQLLTPSSSSSVQGPAGGGRQRNPARRGRPQPPPPQQQQPQQKPPPPQPGPKNGGLDALRDLRELGQRFVQESEGGQSSGSFHSQGNRGAARRAAPPPPPPQAPNRRTQSAGNAVSVSGRELGQMRRQQAAAAAASMISEAEGALSSRLDGMGFDDAGRDGQPPSPRGQDRASAERRREKAEKAERRRLRAERRAEREMRRRGGGPSQEQLDLIANAVIGGGRVPTDDGHDIFEMPMNDTAAGAAASNEVRARSRGRSGRGGGTDDILQQAAAVRARARRSASRSRERVQAAAQFCGDYTAASTDGEGDDDYRSVASGRSNRSGRSGAGGKRSILNPHGLEEPPPPVRMVRRSQSRERRRRPSRTAGGDDAADYPNPSQTSAEELLSKRREMRERIRSRQDQADAGQVARGRGRADSDGEGWDAGNSFNADENASRGGRGRNRSGSDGRGRARSRSRSVVREGLSKIRSASIGPFGRRKSTRTIDEDGTVGSGRSRSSSVRGLLRRRSASRGRSGGDARDGNSDNRSVGASFSKIRRSLSRGRPAGTPGGYERRSSEGVPSEWANNSDLTEGRSYNSNFYERGVAGGANEDAASFARSEALPSSTRKKGFLSRGFSRGSGSARKSKRDEPRSSEDWDMPSRSQSEILQGQPSWVERELMASGGGGMRRGHQGRDRMGSNF